MTSEQASKRTGLQPMAPVRLLLALIVPAADQALLALAAHNRFDSLQPHAAFMVPERLRRLNSRYAGRPVHQRSFALQTVASSVALRCNVSAP